MATQRITLIENTDQTVNFTVKDKTGAVVVLTGSTLRFAAKEKRNDVDADKLFDILCVITDGPNGKAQAEVPGTSIPKGFRGGLAELSIWAVLNPTTGELPDERAIFLLDIAHSVMQGGFP